MSRGDPVDHRICRPRLVLRSLIWRRGQDFQLDDGFGLLANRGTEAVRTGVAAADDHHMLVFGGDLVLHRTPEGDPIGLRQVLHRLVDAVQLTAGNREVASDRRTDGQHDGVVAFAKLITGYRNADLDAAPEVGALVLHLPDPAIQDGFLHLELRNAVPQQTPRLVGAFVNGDSVSGPAQLLGCRQAGRTGADDRDSFPGVPLRRLRRHPALVPGPVDDRDFDVLDGDRITVDTHHARGLTGCRAQPPGELREVIGGVQALQRLVPVAAPDQVVPLRDQVSQWAPGVAERDAAVHAASRLL